jgi:uncharacterized protein
MIRRLVPLLIAFAIFLLIMLVPGSVQLFTDWLWFREVGYERVFLTEWGWRIALFVTVYAAAFSFLYFNLRHAQRGIVPNPYFLRVNPDAAPLDVTRLFRRLSLPAALVLGFGAASAAAAAWLQILQHMNRVPFGVVDPVFGRDVAFYVFTLPVIAIAVSLLLGLVLMTLLLVVPLYLVRGDLILRPPLVRLEPSAGWHIAILGALMFLLIGAQIWWVQVPELLYSRTGPLVGASFTDLNARLPAYRVLSVVAVACAAFILYGAARQRTVLHGVLAAIAFAVAAGIGAMLVPAGVQRLYVAPTELTRESPQIEHHVDMTRRAWGLDRVDVRDLSGGEARLTMADLRNNAATIENVRLWDREPLLQTFGQLQEIRTYYDFVAVDDDRYWINGRYRQVLLSPRELNAASLPQRTFINQHLTFTHGMGVTLAPVNQVTAEGLPVLFIKDLPPVSSIDLPVTRPQIYFGELTDNFIFVNTQRREFDFPAGDQNVFREYTGTAGVRVGSMLRRLLITMRFGGMTALLSNDIRADSRVIYHRRIEERVRRALPFLTFDRDPYIVIRPSGELVWIFDGYTSSSRYPYAERIADGTNYLRNSVKVVVDAYNGDIHGYIVDPEDPIAATYARVFPGILQPFASMPEDLRAHIRYPEDLYRLQTALYTVYHMDEPETFYHREDQWQIPMLGAERGGQPFMRRIIMRLPDEPDPEFIFVTQFTPRGRDNLAAWMVARNDGDHYGQLVVYRFPRQSLVFGPRQVMNRINQDTEIARQISLWDQRGSQVIRGELLVIPVEEALIYVQPLYLRAEGGRIPELKRVIVAYENQVVMEETLDEALEVLFAGAPPSPIEDPDAPAPPTPAAPPPGTPGAPTAPGPGTQIDAETLRQMQEQYERARREVERLGELLRQLQRARAGGGNGG